MAAVSSHSPQCLQRTAEAPCPSAAWARAALLGTVCTAVRPASHISSDDICPCGSSHSGATQRHLLPRPHRKLCWGCGLHSAVSPEGSPCLSAGNAVWHRAAPLGLGAVAPVAAFGEEATLCSEVSAVTAEPLGRSGNAGRKPQLGLFDLWLVFGPCARPLGSGTGARAAPGQCCTALCLRGGPALAWKAVLVLVVV